MLARELFLFPFETTFKMTDDEGQNRKQLKFNFSSPISFLPRVFELGETSDDHDSIKNSTKSP